LTLTILALLHIGLHHRLLLLHRRWVRRWCR
jgi:hypothetical protein